MTKPKRNAREDILNTAEHLFAKEGIENVSLRAINAEAGYSAAALHYHFKSREKLLEALLADRQRPVMATREALLIALKKAKKPSVESLAEALVFPFSQLILTDPGRGLISVNFFFRAYVERRMLEPVRRTTEDSLQIFEPLLASALPDVDAPTRRVRWLMVTEITFQGLANMESIIARGPKRLARDEMERYVRTLVEFVAGGLSYPQQVTEQ